VTGVLRLLAVLAVVLAGAPAGADELDAAACLACHGSADFSVDGRALAVDAQAFAGSSHGVLACTACHGDATEIPHATLQPVALDVCSGCHSDAVEVYRASIHGTARAQGVREAATCADCHGDLHAVRPHTEPASAAYWSKLAARCARCHANAEVTERFRIPIVRPVEAYLASAHARAVTAGLRGAVCSDCHGAHDIRAAVDPQASIWRTNIPATCGKCHEKIFDEYRASVHGEALVRGARSAPVCTDCHGEHRILGPGEPTSPVFAANIPGETCGQCHGNTRMNERYGLSGTQVSAFRDSFHGLALRAGKLTVANCASCHGVHDIRRASDPQSHVHPANLPATCGKCHPGAGSRFALGPVHAGTTSASARIVAWVRRIYLWLIVVTIAAMAFHNGLDLATKARHALPLARGTSAAVVRMPRALRWQHGLVMVSFPLLVYTGFALTYPEHWWAAPLVRWETELGLRGLLHRSAAVMLLTALAWHAGHLVASARLRTGLRGLLPRWRDVRAALATVAYYLGRRRVRPAAGAFSYVEKVEYWAFVWGMAIMTVTGLMLWFENTALAYLPKWTTDVATAVHFYEAVLATLAIVVWHLYWVIFDPEVYPMDWSWWDGHPPASRAHERGEGREPDPPPTLKSSG
jgi:cytochrome b subunit of formate dehydrogenase